MHFQVARGRVSRFFLFAASLVGSADAFGTGIAFSNSGSSVPQTSTWNGSTWSGAASLPSIGGEAYWVVYHGCPARGESAVAALDAGNDINLTIHNGISWGAVTEVTTDAGGNGTRPFDLAYEQASGDLLFVYWDNPSLKLYYRTWNGTTLSAAAQLTLPDSNAIRYVRCVPKPGANEIIVLALSSAQDLHAAVWNGSSFGAVSTLETNTSTATMECFQCEYESLTGEALLVYAVSGSNQPRYRIWNGSWSSAALAPSIGGVANWIRLAADPKSNSILMGALDSSNDINVNVWNGSAWGTNQEIEDDTNFNNRRQFDIAYEAGTGKGLLVYVDKNYNMPMYRTWDGTSWSGQLYGTNINRKPQVIQLMPGSSASEIFIATSDDFDDLHVFRWDGTSMGVATEVTYSHGGSSLTEPFMLSVANVKLKIVNWREVPNPELVGP